uniref:Uncharacterized protein n=1 Tax=Anguilla anguilla TaxID=7936 RepID=A0A0E9W309_ANGAN
MSIFAAHHAVRTLKSNNKGIDYFLTH